MRKIALLAIMFVAPAVPAKSEPVWSKPVNGLRARLAVLPSKDDSSPFVRVFIEFENVADVAGQKNLRFNPSQLKMRVTSEDGKDLPTASGAYDGSTPMWRPILLPYAGAIKFQVSFPGLGFRSSDKTIVDVGPANSWVIPADGSKYFLSAILTIKSEKGDHRSMDWSGSLELPAVGIP